MQRQTIIHPLSIHGFESLRLQRELGHVLIQSMADGVIREDPMKGGRHALQALHITHLHLPDT